MKMNEEQLNEQVTGVPTFDSYSSKVTYVPFSDEDEAGFQLNVIDVSLEDKAIQDYKKAMENPQMYSKEYLEELEMTAQVKLKFEMLKQTDRMLAQVDAKLQGIKQAEVTSQATQQTTELAKQTAIQYFSALSQVGSNQDLIAFAKANKDSVELLSLVHMKLSSNQVTVTDTQALSEVKQLLDEALGLPEKAQLMEYKELLLRNKEIIRNDGLMYLPNKREHLSVDKLLGKKTGLDGGAL